jgi:hypothetical protein
MRPALINFPKPVVTFLFSFAIGCGLFLLVQYAEDDSLTGNEIVDAAVQGVVLGSVVTGIPYCERWYRQREANR